MQTDILVQVFIFFFPIFRELAFALGYELP